MKADDIAFPVSCLYKDGLFTSTSLDALTRTTTAALRGGLFNGLQIVDSSGREYAVNSVRKLHGIGPIWGVNMFLNRSVRIETDLDDNPKTLGVYDVRRLVLRDFQDWHGWKSRGDFEKLRAAVETASTVAEIIHLVAS